MPPVSRHPSNMDDVSDEGDNICPLCMEEMDMTDRQFKPCLCGYQICVWCWHHIMEMAEKDNIEGRCPACRMSYDKEKIVATTISCERWLESSNEKKQRSNKSKSRAVEGRKNLSNVRVLQRNLVYVVGLPANLADEEALERREFFGQYGKILKLSISRPSSHYSQHSSSGSTVSVYVTFSKEEDATRCIQAVNGCCLEGSTLRACLGTTKYCNAWLKNMQCNNPECLYLHDEGNREDSFTKEEMLAKFGSKAQQFQELTHSAQRYFGTGLPPPITEVSAALPLSNPAASTGSPQKSSLDVGSSGKITGLPAAASWGSRGTSVTRSSSVRPSGPISTRPKVHKPPNSPVPGSCFQTAPASVLPLASTTASVTVLGCRSSSELLNPTVLMSGSPKLLVAPKQSIVKNGKMAVGLLQSSSNTLLTSEIGSLNTGVAALSVEGKSGKRDSSLPLESQNATSSCADDIVFDSHEDNGALIKLADTVDDRDKNDMKNAGMRIQPMSGIKISNYNSFGSFSCDTPTDSGDIVMAVCSKELGSVLKISDCSSGIASHIKTEAHTCSIEANMGTSHVAADTVHDSSNVGGLNIKLDVSESNESGSEGKNEFLLPSDELLKDAWLQSVAVECSETSSDSRSQEAVMTTIELNLLKNPSIQNEAGEYSWTDGALGNQEGGGTGESKLYSDVLPTGFDIWSDGSPDDLADLVFGEKKDSLLSPNSCEGTSIWKSQSSRQSRFHFARQKESRHQDSLKDLSSPTRTCSEVVFLQSAQTAEPVTIEQIDSENSNSDFYKCNRLSSDGIFDSTRGANNKGKTIATPSPKSLLSAPPGFSLSTRATSTPPGFSNGKNVKASGQVLDKTCFAPTASNNVCQQAVSGSSEIEFMDPAIMAVGRGKFRASLNDPMLLVPERNMQSSSVNRCWNSSPGAINAKEYSRAFDSDLNSQVQPMALYRDANSPSHSLNQNLDARFPSFLPYLNERTSSARLFMPSYQDRPNNMITKIGIQDLGYGTPELRFQQSGGNIWESWSRVGSVADSTIARQRLPYNGVGNSNATHPIVERTFQSLYGERTSNKEIPSRSFWDALPLNGQNDQGQYHNQRIL